MPLLLTSLYLLTHSHQIQFHPHLSLSSITLPNPLVMLHGKNKNNNNNNNNNNRLQEVTNQVGQIINSTYKHTADTIQTLNISATQTRHKLHSIARSTPFTKSLSNDYIHGFVDALLTATIVSLSIITIRRASRHYLTVDDIPLRLIKKQATLRGNVISVRDGDNLRVRHTPLINLHTITTKIRQFFGNPSSTARKKPLLSQSTINIRLAGIDAPECAHGIRPGQPHGREARAWLRAFTNGKKVYFKIHSIDQYRRIIATVYVKRSKWNYAKWKNVGLELTKQGYATLYKGAGACYGNDRLLNQYVKAEALARKKGKGMWASGGRNGEGVVLPAEFKRMLRGVASSSGNNNSIERNANGNDDGMDQIQNFIRAVADGYEWLKRFR